MTMMVSCLSSPLPCTTDNTLSKSDMDTRMLHDCQTKAGNADQFLFGQYTPPTKTRKDLNEAGLSFKSGCALVLDKFPQFAYISTESKSFLH